MVCVANVMSIQTEGGYLNEIRLNDTRGRTNAHSNVEKLVFSTQKEHKESSRIFWGSIPKHHIFREAINSKAMVDAKIKKTG